MRVFMTLTLSMLGLAMTSAPAEAQAPETDGIWWGGGVGYGITMLSCTICTDEIRTGPMLMLKAGGKVSPSALLGVEASGWMKSMEDVNQTVISLLATGYLYTGTTTGLFLKGGLGPTWYSASESDGDGELGSLGVSLQFGIGYEAQLGESTALTPYLNLLGSGFGSLRVGDSVAAEQFGIAQAQFGVSVTRY